MFHLNKKDEKQSQVWHDFPRQLNVDPGPEKKKEHTISFLRAEMLDHITEKQIYYYLLKPSASTGLCWWKKK